MLNDMESLLIQQSGSWIILIFMVCLIIFVISLAGKFSPKFSLLLIAIVGIVGIALIVPNGKGIAPNESDPDSLIVYPVDTNNVGQVPTVTVEKTTESQKNPPSKNDRAKETEREASQRLVPKAYENIDTKFRTYNTRGNWQWSSSFIRALERETGWTSSKNGNFTISVDYPESFSEDTDQLTRLFIHSGGKVSIKVNGELCCCADVIVIPEHLTGASMKEVKLVIQDTVTNLINQNQSAIIREMKKCL